MRISIGDFCRAYTIAWHKFKVSFTWIVTMRSMWQMSTKLKHICLLLTHIVSHRKLAIKCILFYAIWWYNGLNEREKYIYMTGLRQSISQLVSELFIQSFDFYHSNAHDKLTMINHKFSVLSFLTPLDLATQTLFNFRFD